MPSRLLFSRGAEKAVDQAIATDNSTPHESFSLYISPDYRKGIFPKRLEKFLDDVINKLRSSISE